MSMPHGHMGTWPPHWVPLDCLVTSDGHGVMVDFGSGNTTLLPGSPVMNPEGPSSFGIARILVNLQFFSYRKALATNGRTGSGNRDL